MNKKEKKKILDRKAELDIRARGCYESLVGEAKFERGEARVWDTHVARNIYK